MTEHNWRRVPVPPDQHRYACSCGWASETVTDGDPAAGIAAEQHATTSRQAPH